MPRFTRYIAIVALVSVGGWLSSSPIDAATPVTASSSAAFSFPAPGALRYATTDGWSVRWHLGVSTVGSQRLIERIGIAKANGGCHGATLGFQVVHQDVTSPFRVGGEANRCHRFRLELLDGHGAVVATARSGMLLTLTRWTGTRDLYRRGAFSTQRTPFWCVGASVQMMLNMIRGQRDHTLARQRAYMSYARLHDQATGLLGTNPLGWRATLNRYAGGSRYRIHVDRTLRGAIHDAAQRLRRTGHPVGLLVMGGHHAWVMSGFNSTADPATTNHFKVTSVFVEGPLYPITQSNGFDMQPDTRLTVAALRRFLKPYDAGDPSWNHRYLTVQP
jgi:hypothetical protein